MKPILIVDFHGLWFKGGMDSYIRPAIDAIDDVLFLGDEATSWTQVNETRKLVKSIRNTYSGIVTYGHSMGAGAASKLTDDGYVDLAFMIDPAGAAMSPFGKNTGKVYDFHDTAFAMVPKYRAQTLKGFGHKVYMRFRDGHMGITYSQPMVDIMVREIRSLIAQKKAAA